MGIAQVRIFLVFNTIGQCVQKWLQLSAKTDMVCTACIKLINSEVETTSRSNNLICSSGENFMEIFGSIYNLKMEILSILCGKL